MAQKISFTRNHSDLCTAKGFQFEFQCDRCGTGYRTRFKAYALGTVTGALDAAGGLLGGVLARTAGIAERARSAAWEKAHDTAFVEAMEELKPEFIQCPRCMSWVCRERCWNKAKGLCKARALPSWAWRWRRRKRAALWRRSGHTQRWPTKTGRPSRRVAGGVAFAPLVRTAASRWKATPSSARSAAGSWPRSPSARPVERRSRLAPNSAASVGPRSRQHRA
jgi:hypothetical protein